MVEQITEIYWAKVQCYTIREYRLMEDWCKERSLALLPWYHFHYDERTDIKTMEFSFGNKADAVQFKLEWAG